MAGLALVLYALGRIVTVGWLFSDHGVDIGVFAVIELGTAYPYGVAITRMLARLANGTPRRAAAPAGVAAFCFVAPYAYVALAGEHAPTGLLGGLAIVACVSLGAAVLGGRKRLRALSSARPAES